jgi:4-amino-4-deoxy-L-arabinose transferase-like glycosyltransferase
VRPRGGLELRDFVVAAGLAALFLVGLGRPELLDPDESRHAAIAREMLATRDFLTPRIHGEPYYDKPVGFHWLVAGSLALLGHSTFAARLPSALAALATLATVTWWAWRLYGPSTARWAVLSLGTTYFFVALGRFAGIDMVFTSLLTAAVACVSVAAERLPRHTTRGSDASGTMVLGACALIGLATLVKGPVAIVLALPAWVAARLGSHDRRRNLVLWRGVIVVAGVAAPWFVAAANTDPAYVRTFLELHNLARFLGSDDLPHQRPLAYYAVTLPVALLPWTPWFAIGAIARVRSGGRLSDGERVLLAWVVGVVLLFALARTRSITYLLPAFPAIAVIGCGGLASVLAAASHGTRTLLARWTVAVGWVVALAAMVASFLVLASANTAPRVLAVIVPAVMAATAYAIALRLATRSGSTPLNRCIVLLAAGTFTATLAAYGPVAHLLTVTKGQRELAETLSRALSETRGRVSSLSRATHALSFYAQRTVTRLSDVHAARTALATEQPSFVVTKPSYAEALANDPDGGIEILWRNAQGTTLVTNRAGAASWRRGREDEIGSAGARMAQPP